MKRKQLIYVLAALLAGLAAGYLIFNSPAKDGVHAHSEETGEGQIWTCSMHPQIQQPEPGDCPICGMDLIPADGEALAINDGQFSLTEHAMALANIRTITVGGGEAAGRSLLLSGKISENEEANAIQASYFEGRIEELFINTTGETVRKGQKLATIYSPQLVAAQQELLSAGTLRNTQPALYEAVRNKLKLWKLTDSQINAIETSGKVQEYFPVYATVAGTVTEKMVREGDYVKQGQPLLKIANLASVWAVFDAYENQLGALTKGQEIIISSNAYPNEEIKGKIDFIDPLLNSGSRTVEVRAVIRNSSGRLKPGMFVKGQVATSAPTGTTDNIFLPSSAVLWTGERSVVYVKPNPPEPVFEMREVTLGEAAGDEYVQVLQGLQPGEEVVVNGTFTVDAAAQLKGMKSMMNPSGGVVATGHEGHTGMEPEMPPQGNAGQETELPMDYQKGVIGALEPYFRMKDAMVAGKPAEVAVSAREAATAFTTLGVTHPGHGDKAMHGQVVELLSAIGGMTDLEKQRMHFVRLNQALVSLVKGFTEPGKTIYVQHCPMANNNEGAFWLSTDKEIRNPYYGNAMLTCGSVTDSIK